MRHTLHSPLSLEDCTRRLTEKLEVGSSFFKDPDKVFSGWVRGQRFSLRLARGSRNPFAPHFQGSLERTMEGTMVRGEFKLHDVAKWMALIWMIVWGIMPCGLTAIVEVVLVSFFVAAVENLRGLGDELYQELMTIPVTLLIFPVAGVVVGVGFPVLFAALRISDRDRTIELLKGILEAEDRSGA